MKYLRPFLLFTDVGFIIYWAITAAHLIPDEYLFKDYTNSISIAWNWSFFPLDLAISITGFMTLFYYGRKMAVWQKLCLISLVLTFCSGLLAISFWVLQKDFDLLWWAPNLFLLVFPLPFIWKLMTDNIK
jgi:hypothetical protein